MSVTAKYAWANAERRCFDYLTQQLSAGSNAAGYLAEFPRTAATPTDFLMWCFEAQGGGEVTRFSERAKPWSAWRINASFRAVGTSRRAVMELAGLVRDATVAATGTIEGVASLAMLNEATLTRDTMEVASDQASGGEIVVWKLELPMEMVFGNTEPALE